MYRLAEAAQLPALLEYFEKDLKNCLYSYIDLKKYGMEHPKLHVYYSTRGGEITAAATEYGQGIQLFSYGEELDIPETLELIQQLQTPMINGKKELIEELEPHLGAQFQKELGYVAWMKELQEGADRSRVTRAGEDACMEIAELICSDEDLGGHYDPAEFCGQLIERQRDGFGRNYVRKVDGKIACHAATYAEIRELAVVSGVITRAEYRGRGFGWETVSALCHDLLAEGKRPCIFYYKKEAAGLYAKVGFTEESGWGKLSVRKK